MSAPAARCRVKPLIASVGHCFSSVAHRPYSCMACTSRSISSRLPLLTTDLPVVVHLQHQLLGLLLVVAEVAAEDVGHVAHQVHRVVPHDGDPGLRGERDLVRREVRLDLDRARGRHAPMVAQRPPSGPALALRWPGARVDRPADRPLRADHAAGGPGLRHRPPALGVRAVPAPAPRGPAVRRGGRRRPRARRHRGVPVRRRGARRRSTDVVDEPTREWLADYRFTGDIWGYPEGETYFPYSPLLIVEGTFAEAVLLETVLLSIYNHDSAIASAASRMT